MQEAARTVVPIPVPGAVVEVMSKRDWDHLDRRVSTIIVGDNCCNEESVTELELGRFVNLRELKVGNECFENVKRVALIGLSQLERVEIGKSSFTKTKNEMPKSDPNRCFYLDNCPMLKSLRVGCYSFSDYTVCEIENVDALEIIEMGELDERSLNFHSASLVLNSNEGESE